MTGKQAAMAKDLGFENLAAAEEAKRFVGLPEEERKEFWERHASTKSPPPHFDPPRNPERRRDRAKQEARRAPGRESERRERSIVVREATLKEEARVKLRAMYEEHAHVSLCQVTGCEDRSFKLRDGTWYFEAVRFLGLDKMIADDYVALCPRHAAMFQHANESKNELRRVFSTKNASGDGLQPMTVPVVLGGERVEVFLRAEHVIDLGAALEVEESEI